MDMNSLFEAANTLQRHHQDSIQQLQSLTADVGLLHTPLPPNVADNDKDFAKHLIVIHAVKTTIWNRLQRLQDELSPIKESARRSGVGSLLGTKKLQPVLRTIQNRGKSMLSMVDYYNKLIEDLSLFPLPYWFRNEDLPQPLEKKNIINIGPEADLWDNIAMSQVWFSLWGTSFEEAPAYARDPNVRKGIIMVLQLDRVAEEEVQLKQERENLLREFAARFIAASQLWLSTTSDYQFRARMAVLDMLRNRCNYILGRNLPDVALWRISTHDIIDYLKDGGTADALLLPLRLFHMSRQTNSVQYSDDDIFTTSMEDILDDSGHLRCPPLPFDQGVSEDKECPIFEEHQEAVEEEVTDAADLMAQLSLGISEVRDSGTGIALPPILPLGAPAVGEITGNDAMDPEQLWRSTHPQPKSLPRIRSLFQILDADRMGTNPYADSDRAYPLWSATAGAITERNALRLPMDNRERLCKDFKILSEDFKTLDANRHLGMRIVAAFIRNLQDYFENHRFNELIPPNMRPNVWALDPGYLQTTSEILVYLFIDIDSQPFRSGNLRQQGDEWVWTLLKRFLWESCSLAGKYVDPAEWTTCTTMATTRQARNTDSGLWVLADIEAWYLGRNRAAPDTDMASYRMVVQKAIFGLLLATEEHKNWPVDPPALAHDSWIQKAEKIVRTIAPYNVPEPLKISDLNSEMSNPMFLLPPPRTLPS
ncbi:hypothetical protein M422DRAFT_244389, partial [Sphaerobolus stellatus SS14]